MSIKLSFQLASDGLTHVHAIKCGDINRTGTFGKPAFFNGPVYTVEGESVDAIMAAELAAMNDDFRDGPDFVDYSEGDLYAVKPCAEKIRKAERRARKEAV